jgi:hypothetical protein
MQENANDIKNVIRTIVADNGDLVYITSRTTDKTVGSQAAYQHNGINLMPSKIPVHFFHICRKHFTSIGL